MKTIKELEAFERDHNNNPEITSNKMNPRHQGKLQALKDVLGLIDETKKEVIDCSLCSFCQKQALKEIEELKARIEG